MWCPGATWLDTRDQLLDAETLAAWDIILRPAVLARGCVTLQVSEGEIPRQMGMF